MGGGSLVARGPKETRWGASLAAVTLCLCLALPPAGGVGLPRIPQLPFAGFAQWNNSSSASTSSAAGAPPPELSCDPAVNCGGSGGVPPLVSITFLSGWITNNLCLGSLTGYSCSHILTSGQSFSSLTGATYPISADGTYTATEQWMTNTGVFLPSGQNESVGNSATYETLQPGLLDSAVNGSVSSNWAGYIVGNGQMKVTQVSGEFQIPASATWTTCTAGDCSVGQWYAMWVGLGGAEGDDLWQAGVFINIPCATCSEQLIAWEEYYPQQPNAVTVNLGTISPGDVIYIEVGGSGSTSTYEIKDISTGYTATGSYPLAPPHLTGEWVSEDPVYSSGSVVITYPMPTTSVTKFLYPAATYSCSPYNCGSGAASFLMPMFSLWERSGFVCGVGCNTSQTLSPSSIDQTLQKFSVAYH